MADSHYDPDPRVLGEGGGGLDLRPPASRPEHAHSPASGVAAEAAFITATAPRLSHLIAPVRPRINAGSWEPIDLRSALADIAAGRDTHPRPGIGKRTDGIALLYAGLVQLFIGESGAGKSILAQHIAAQELMMGRSVIYVDFEDRPSSICARLHAMGVDLDVIRGQCHYFAPEIQFDTAARESLATLVAATRPSLVVIDSVGEAMSLQGLNANSDTDVVEWLNLLPRPLARLGPAVVLIDHVAKNPSSRGRYPIGSQRKLAGAGAAHIVETVAPLGIRQLGASRITTAKDRHGNHLIGRAVALFVVDATTTGALRCTLEPPSSTSATADLRPSALMEELSRLIEQAGSGLSKNELERAATGKATAIRAALAILVEEKFVRGDINGRAHRHYSVRPYRIATDPVVTGSEPR